jgi:hypothetical protein
MPVEIDETQLGNLRTIAKITEGLLNNPKTRRQYLTAVKEANPTMSIPEIDAAAPIVSDLDGIKKQVGDFITEMRTERQKEKEDAALSKLQESYNKGRQQLLDDGYTADGLAEIEKMMQAKGIADWEDARAIWERTHPPAAPARPARGNAFDFQEQRTSGDDYVKKLFESHGDDETVLNAQISTVLAESRQGLGGARR